MTNIAKHTPGPWQLHDGLRLMICATKAPKDIAIMCEATSFGREQQANANLIAAAPELLKTLQAVAELRCKWRSQDEAETIDSIEYMDGLDALDLDTVIAKATGDKP